MQPRRPLKNPKRRAQNIGIMIGVGVFLLILIGSPIAISMGLGAPLSADDAYERGRSTTMGAAMLGITSGLIAWGISHLVLCRKTKRP